MSASPNPLAPRLTRSLGRRAVRFALRRLTEVAFLTVSDLRIIGREHVPQSGPLIVTANHFHYADPVAVLRALPRDLEFVGGLQMPHAPAVVTWIPKLWGYYPVRRGGVSREALGAAQAILAAGGALGIFPEAGSWATVLRPARPGAAFLAVETGAPVLPIGLDGMTELFQRRRPTVTVRIGRPIGPFAAAGRGRARRAQLDAIGETIMRAIAALIPPARHGVFSADPALRAAAEAVAAYPFDEPGLRGV